MVCRLWIILRKVWIFDMVEHHPTPSPTHCHGCGAKFSVAHGRKCKKGGFVIQRHEEIKSVKALPQIYSDRSTDVEETEGMSTSTDERGDLLIRNNAPSSIHRKPEEVLVPHEREIWKKCLQACLDQRHHFSPLLVSYDGVLGK